MADTLLWIIAILGIGYLAWNYIALPAIGNFALHNPKGVIDLIKLNNKQKADAIKQLSSHPQAANYGYYYY